MKNDFLFKEVNGDEDLSVIKAIKTIEQRLTKEMASNQNVIEWQLEELKRLQSEVAAKNNSVSELNTRLAECRAQSEGSRQLINKLITDIDKLQQNIDWYKRTYESRSLFGVIKDKLKHLFR